MIVAPWTIDALDATAARLAAAVVAVSGLTDPAAVADVFWAVRRSLLAGDRAEPVATAR